MKIRVAYDISFMATYLNNVENKNGIYRVVEEVMSALSRREDIELTALGLCGRLNAAEDPLLDAVYAYRCVEDLKEQMVCQFDPSFKSSLHLSKFYFDVFSACESQNRAQHPQHSLRSLYFLGMRSVLYRLYQTYKIDTLRRHFSAEKFDVFHSPYPELPSLRLTKKVPRVLTVYDLIPILAAQSVPPEAVTSFKKLLDSIDIERDWVACISEYTRQEFCDYSGMSPDRVFVTPLAAASHFHPVAARDRIAAARRRYGIPDGDYFLSVAALQPRKNLAHLIRCFFQLISEQPALDVNLVLAGYQGWMYDEILAAAGSSPKFRSRVIFTGFVQDADLSAIYSDAKAFVYPSLYEGFGLPPLEAMQCGTPVITANTTSLPEVVGDAGLMVDPKDTAALCEAMLDVLTNATLHQELSHKGLERSKQFTWERCAAETAQIYKRAVSV